MSLESVEAPVPAQGRSEREGAGGDGATLIISAGGFLLPKAFTIHKMLCDPQINEQIHTGQNLQIEKSLWIKAVFLCPSNCLVCFFNV